MKINKTLKETIGITDEVSATTMLSPEIYYEKFLEHKNNYFKLEDERELVFSYIFLHIYFEVHFHYYLWLLVGGGLGSKNINFDKKAYPIQKLNKFEIFLEEKNFSYETSDFKEVRENLRLITNIRNHLIHGHPVTKTYKNDTVSVSNAKSFLTRQKFNETTTKANTIANAWNKILSSIQRQTDLLRSNSMPNPSFFDECKFKVF